MQGRRRCRASCRGGCEWKGTAQYYDVVVDGARHERAAWSYEAPRPEMSAVGGRFGFWQDVEVA